MIYFGIQPINMTSTKLQNKHRERPSFPIKMIHVMIFNMILKKKIQQLIKIHDEPSPYSVFQSSFNSSAPKEPTKVFIPYQLWGEFPEAVKQMVIEYNKKIDVVSPKPHFNGGKSKPNPTLGKPNSNPQQVHLHEKDDTAEN